MSDSGSNIDKDFSSDSSDLYYPSGSESTTDKDIPGPSVGRRRSKRVHSLQNDVEAEGNKEVSVPLVNRNRRVLNPSKWKRNLIKKSIAEGKEYTNHKGKLVGPRKTGQDCHCRNQCFEKINENERRLVLDHFNKIGDRHLQDTYLGGLIRTNSVERIRPKSGARKKRSCSHKYDIRVGKQTVRVCRTAFGSIHGISRKRVDNIAKSFRDKNITTPTSRQGKHSNRPNRLPKDAIDQVDSHIKSFPKRVSHYSRNKTKRYYLSPELNVTRMYQLYLKHYEPEATSDTDYKPKVTYDFYYRYFKENFAYRFGSPRSDTCKKCDILEIKLKDKTMDDSEQTMLRNEKDQHLIKADIFFKELKRTTSLCKNKDDMEVLTFDFQQNLPLPKITAGEAFYKRQLWLYNFCIYSGRTKKAHFYLYDETIARKSPNEVISFLYHYLNNILPKNITELHLFSDNAAAQNKNSIIVQFLFLLVKSTPIRKIIHHYPEPGHSFLPCDRCFGVIEKFLRKKDYIFNPQQYANCIKQASKSFIPVMVPQNMVLNFSKHYDGHFKKVIVSDTKQRFKISQYKIFKYDKDHPTSISASVSTGFPIFETYILLRNVEDPLTLAPTTRAYEAPLLLKKPKYEDVMQLARKYVPLNETAYYENLKSQPHGTDQVELISATDDDDQPDE